MGPFETIDLNAPGGVRDYVERYQGIYERLHPSTQRRVDWAGPVIDIVEAERRGKVARRRSCAAAPCGGTATSWRWPGHKRRSRRDLGG